MYGRDEEQIYYERRNRRDEFLATAAIGFALAAYVYKGTAGYRIKDGYWCLAYIGAVFGIFTFGYFVAMPRAMEMSWLFFGTCGVWIVVAIGGLILLRRNVVRQMNAQRPHLQQAANRAALQHQQYQEAAQRVAQRAHEAEKQADADRTAEAMVRAMRHAYQETREGSQETRERSQEPPQARQEPSQARSRHRNVVDVPALPPGPQRPTAAPQAPPPPTGPVGSGSPTLWVPTYSGPAKPVQRRETSLGGISIIDRRGVDPDGL